MFARFASPKVLRPTRRGFLGGGAGLVLGIALAPKVRAQGAGGGEPVAANAFIRVAPDNTVTVLVKHIEMGQGANTGLPILVAEEMDADWSQIRAEAAPEDVTVYKHLGFGVQGTGGSSGLSNSYMQMREAGAAARAMLVDAAARVWGVSAQGITVAKGVVSHEESGRSASFGELAEEAGNSPVPVGLKLKDPEAFELIGRDVVRTDVAAKTDGTAVFTLDLYRDGMQVVAMLHPPQFGATAASVDDAEAKAVSGVTRVAQVPSGVAVYGETTFAALKGRDALRVEWDLSQAETRSSAEIAETFLTLARAPARVVGETDGVDAAFDRAERVIEADYVFPYLAHAPMEPLDGVIELRDGKAELWLGSQFPTVDAQTAAATLGIDHGDVTLHTMFAGGSFGRRATPAAHFAAELASVAKAGGDGSYKLMWTRENDIRGGYYRPLSVHHMRGALDAEGNITAWSDTVANQSIIDGTPFASMMKDGLDPSAYEGSNDLPYAMPQARLSWAQGQARVPTLWWRSVGHTHTGYAVETFLDELFLEAGTDPVAGRLKLMKDDRPRDRAVLERVAEMAGWSGPGTGERRMGVGVVRSFESYVAQIAEVEDRGGMPHVTRVWCAVDCGRAVTPDVVRAQMEGGIGYGLGSILFDEITLGPDGRVQQSNFDDYRSIRIGEMPRIEVSIIDSAADPTGVGEPGTPPIAPATANAWRALTGQMQYRLPFRANLV